MKTENLLQLKQSAQQPHLLTAIVTLLPTEEVTQMGEKLLDAPRRGIGPVVTAV